MDEEKDLLKLGLIILGLAAILFAVWRVMSYQESRPALPPVTKTIRLNPNANARSRGGYQPESFEAVKNRELLDPFIVSTAPIHTSSVSYAPGREEPLRASTRRTTEDSVPVVSSSASKRQPPINRSSLVGPTNPASVQTPNQPVSGFRPGVYQPTAQEALAEERESYLAPFLIDRKKQEEINQKLSSLSSNIARALQRALTPKSKKNTNIEKYLNRAQGIAAGTAAETQAQADPFQTVLNQISGQKTGIVKSMVSTFGARAGQRAGQLMDNMAKDVSAVIQTPNQTDRQKAEKIQKLAQNYDKKFEKLKEQSQYEKFVSDRVEHDTAQKNALAAKYPGQDELNAKLGQIIDASRERDLELSQRQDLTRDEYYAQLQDNHYQTHQALENAIKEAGVSLSGLHQVDNEQAAQDLKDRQQLEEEGKIISVAHVSSAKETERLERRLNKESEDMLKQVEASFGKEKAAGLQTILDGYHNAMLKTMSMELSDTDRQKSQMKLRNESNLQILQWQKEQVSQLDIPQDQKQVALERLEQEITNLEQVISAQEN